MPSTEEIYDEQISPLMKQIIEICKENKIPLITEAVVKTNEGEKLAVSTRIPESEDDLTPHFQMIKLAQLSRGNLDTLFTAIRDYVDKHGHQSIFWNRFQSFLDSTTSNEPTKPIDLKDVNHLTMISII